MPKITFNGHYPIPHEQLLEQIAHARGLGFPFVREAEPHDRTLAIAGGGPSIVSHLQELRFFASVSSVNDLWAINGACGFLRERGIESTLFALDPVDWLASRVKGAKKAILATRCHPSVFETLKDCDITLFDIAQDTEKGEGIWGSVSAVLSVFSLAPFLGYRRVIFYGCEGSFEKDSHAYMNEADCFDYRFVVSVGGREYITAPDMYAQSIELSKLLRFTKGHFEERSGGLLRAFLAERMKHPPDALEIEPEHDIVKVSRALLAGLVPMKEAA